MTSAREMFCIVLVCLVMFGVMRECNANGLRKNFYGKSCPQAEQLVRNITWSKAKKNPSLGAKLLRMHFHDCFVRGCDASVLLDMVGTTKSEKDTIPNLTLSGFDVIGDIKTQVEQACPDIVSCADILALAAWDSVSFPFKQPKWDVLTGRRDGRISLASDVTGNIPSPFSDFITLRKIFAKKGLNTGDLVVLSGAHTIGVAHCATFSNMLYNFTGKGGSDPSLNPTYAQSLKKQCPNPAKSSTTVEMDPRSSLTFDTHYFTILMGLFQSDAALRTDKKSAKMVKQLQSTDDFFFEFNVSMMKMGDRIAYWKAWGD
nr:peroxidase 24 [Vaccinium corymbosum]